MLMLELALVALLTTKETASKPPAPANPPLATLFGPELVGAIKSDIESISGRGTVDVSIDSKTLFNVRIAIPGFSSEIYSRVYDRELEFYQAFPDLSFDFYLRPR